MLSTGKISYYEKGISNDTIICLHGIGGDNESFEPQVNGLSDKYRIISWNMPGYRDSKPLEKYSFENLSIALNEFLLNLNLEKVNLMGQSIGGMLAQEFYYHYPKKVKSLILIATTSAFGGKKQDFKKQFLEKRLKPISEGKKMKELAKYFVPSILSKSASTDVINKAIKSMERVSEETYKNVIECLVTFDRYHDLPLIQVPCCLISGSEDTNSPSKTMMKMFEKLQFGEYYDLEDTGHLVNLESPEKTNNIVLKFLDKIKKNLET